MGQLSRAALEAFFETGDKPTQSQFKDLIDSQFNFVDDGAPAVVAGANKQIQFNDAGSLGANTNFAWDILNNRLAIGNPPSVTGRLHIKGSGQTSATFSLKIDDINDNPLLNVRDDGLISINHSTPLANIHLATTVSNAGFIMYRQGQVVTDRFKLFIGDGTGGFNADQAFYWARNSIHHFGSGNVNFDERFEISLAGIKSFKRAIFFGNELGYISQNPPNVGASFNSSIASPNSRLNILIGTGTTVGGLLYENERVYIQTHNTNIHFRDSNSTKESITLLSTGLVGMGLSTNITAQCHIKGVNGYDQLRLETTFTPANSADANGNVGDVSWDPDFLYIKTAVGAWKRTALSVF